MARIIVADDSWLTRKILGTTLEGHGHQVVQATNGREALAAIAAQDAECLILDLLMPEMSGLEVLEHLANSGSALAVVVHTADIQLATRNRCLELGASAFLNKPVDGAAIEAAIQEALDKRSGVRE